MPGGAGNKSAGFAGTCLTAWTGSKIAVLSGIKSSSVAGTCPTAWAGSNNAAFAGIYSSSVDDTRPAIRVNGCLCNVT